MSDGLTPDDIDAVMSRTRPVKPRPANGRRRDGERVTGVTVTDTPREDIAREGLGDGDTRDAPETTIPPADAPRWQAFPLEALPQPVRGYADRAARAIGCDPSMVAVPMLAVLASLLGNTRRVSIKRRWNEPCILWTATVLKSGGGKSPAFDAAIEPLQQIQHELIQRHVRERETYDTAKLTYDRDLAKWKRSGGDEPPEEPAEPTVISVLTTDATVEALAALLQDNPRGLLLGRDELSGWIGSFDRYAKGGGGDAAHWLAMHGGRPLRVDRKTGQRITYVRQASVSVTGTIQPAILRRVLGEVNLENGMGARLMLAMPPQRPRRWSDEDVPEDDLRVMQELTAGLYALQPMHDDDGQPQPRLVKLTPGALERFIAFFNAHNAETPDLSSDELTAAYAKLEGGAARLALVHHLIRVVNADPSVNDPDAIDAASMDAGIALSQWFKNEAKRIYAMLGETDPQKEQRKLIEWIERKGGEVSVNDLTHGQRRYRNLTGKAKADLHALTTAGIGEWVYPRGPGRPSPKLRLIQGVTGVTVTDTPTDTTPGRGLSNGDTSDTPTPKLARHRL